MSAVSIRRHCSPLSWRWPSSPCSPAGFPRVAPRVSIRWWPFATNNFLPTDIVNDLRYSLRMLVKSPAFTVIAVLTLGLGIAATTAIFSVVDAVLLHPLPYPHSEQIISVSQTVRSTGISTDDSSPANFLDW